MKNFKSTHLVSCLKQTLPMSGGLTSYPDKLKQIMFDIHKFVLIINSLIICSKWLLSWLPKRSSSRPFLCLCKLAFLWPFVIKRKVAISPLVGHSDILWRKILISYNNINAQCILSVVEACDFRDASRIWATWSYWVEPGLTHARQMFNPYTFIL